MQNLENLQLGRFKVTKLLGIGGFAVVYKVLDTKDQNEKVIKLLAKEWIKDEKIEKSFFNEGELARVFNHPNIIKIFEVGRIYGEPYHLMEYSSATNLRQWMEASDHEKNVQNISYLAHQIAAALDYIHEKGFIHRDVKPENFLVSLNQDVKMLDFGISAGLLGIRLKDIGSSGTPRYMSPEQKAGRNFDIKTDTYAFGIMLKELLEIGKIELPSESASVLNNALDVNPKKRPSDLKKFSKELFDSINKSRSI
jgi:serine/threonine protein kinase